LKEEKGKKKERKEEKKARQLEKEKKKILQIQNAAVTPTLPP